jgi:chromosome segregation ATPase
MRLDDLSDAFEAFTDRARNVLGSEIERTRKIVKALTAEKDTAEKALAELKDQTAATKKQLDDVVANLERGQTLAKLNSEIAEAKKILAGLTSETEEASAELATLRTQCKAAENQLNAANDGMHGIRQERIEATTAIEHIRSLLKGVELRRPA